MLSLLRHAVPVALLLSYAATGCSAGGFVPVYLSSENRTPEKYMVVSLGLETYLGLTPKWSDTRYGAVTIDVHHADLRRERVLGRTSDHWGCRRYVWANPDPVVVAHEAGHALGLDHTCELKEENLLPGQEVCRTDRDKFNLMDPEPPRLDPFGEVYLTADQLDTVWNSAWWLDQARPG